MAVRHALLYGVRTFCRFMIRILFHIYKYNALPKKQILHVFRVVLCFVMVWRPSILPASFKVTPPLLERSYSCPSDNTRAPIQYKDVVLPV